MALKNLFDMVKADRYTADGREEIIKAQEAETEDKVYQIGEISQKTGLQKTANGWVKPKSGKQPGTKKEEVNKSVTSKKDEIWKDMKKREGALRAKGMTSRHFMDDPEYAHLSELYKNELETEEKPAAESKPDAGNSLPDIPDFKGMESGDYDNKLRAEGWTTGGWEGNGTHASAIFKKGDRTIRVNEGQPGKITSVEEINKPAENTTTIRQGPNTKTLNETPAEHIQKNLDAYKGYSDYDMEELVLEPSGYKRSTGENLRGGREVITYTKKGAKDISLYFDKNGELEDVYIARGEPFDSAPRQLTGDTRIRVRK